MIPLIWILATAPFSAQEFYDQVTPGIAQLISTPALTDERFAIGLNYSRFQLYPYLRYNNRPSFLGAGQLRLKEWCSIAAKLGGYSSSDNKGLMGFGGLELGFRPAHLPLIVQAGYTRTIPTEFFPGDPNYNFSYKGIDIVQISPFFVSSLGPLQVHLVTRITAIRFAGQFRRDITGEKEQIEGFSYGWGGGLGLGFKLWGIRPDFVIGWGRAGLKINLFVGW
jgi:hypothetical protein